MNRIIRFAEIAAEAEMEIMPQDEMPPLAPVIDPEHLRMAEALLFAASEPLSEQVLASSMPKGADVPRILAELQGIYEKRGVTLVRVADKWQFRTAPDLAFLLRKERPEQKRLSRAAIGNTPLLADPPPI